MADSMRKQAPPVEIAGLKWLADAPNGAAVVTILEEGDGWYEMERIDSSPATPEGAEAFGRALAHTHAAGADWHGQAPPGISGTGQMGAASLPYLDADPQVRWGAFYAEHRLLHYLPDARANGSIDADGAKVIERCAARLANGDFDSPLPRLVQAPAGRLHGDLWSGNVLFADGGATGTLIDPAAQGGHPECDLAQLEVFGMRHLERIWAAYDEESPLGEGWRERTALHQLHILIIHAVLFGGGYGHQTVAAARQYV